MRKISDIDEYHWLRQELNEQQKEWLKKIINQAHSIGYSEGAEVYAYDHDWDE